MENQELRHNSGIYLIKNTALAEDVERLNNVIKSKDTINTWGKMDESWGDAGSNNALQRHSESDVHWLMEGNQRALGAGANKATDALKRDPLLSSNPRTKNFLSTSVHNPVSAIFQHASGEFANPCGVPFFGSLTGSSSARTIR
jgi:hypothetical protein